MPLGGQGRQAPLARRLLGNDGMNAIVFRVKRKNGDYVQPTLVPADDSKKVRVDPRDVAIVTFFVLSVSGLIWLLL